MGENPKGPNVPSQFHHKYPDWASGTELIVQARAAAPPETALPVVGGCRPRQETPPDVTQAPWPRHRPTALDQAWRHFEAGLDSGPLDLWLDIWGLVGLSSACTGLGNDRRGRQNLQTRLARNRSGV